MIPQTHLETLVALQKVNPHACIGGSIGLLLHGYILDRDYNQVDLDFTCPDGFIWDNDDIVKPEAGRGESADMDLALKVSGIKIQVQQYVTNVESVIVYYKGYHLRVRRFMDIIKWKVRYATCGIQKHIDDLKRLDLYDLCVSANRDSAISAVLGF